LLLKIDLGDHCNPPANCAPDSLLYVGWTCFYELVQNRGSNGPHRPRKCYIRLATVLNNSHNRPEWIVC